MGQLCPSHIVTEDEKELRDSRRMDRVLLRRKAEEEKRIKLLLLGTGESGKSTIFKQMHVLYVDKDFSEADKAHYRPVIRRNILESVQTLLFGIEKFALAFKDPRSEAAARMLQAVDLLTMDFWSADITPNVQLLWRHEPAMRAAFELRSKMQLMDQAAYFFDHIDRIGRPDYVPDANDILRARHRTSGIVERTFRINNVDFVFLDVGGQRNERRKWIHCFEGVTAVLFVAAISEFDQVLWEDEATNRLHEAIRVFEQIINNQYFFNSTIILFLNKIDIFAEKIRRVPLKLCFPHYNGDNSFENAAEYIKARFLEQNQDDKRFIFPHFTCATDSTNVQKVFEACKLTILQENLKKLGIHE